MLGRRRRTRKKFASLRPANFLLVILFPAWSSQNGPKSVQRWSETIQKRFETIQKWSENDPVRSENVWKWLRRWGVGRRNEWDITFKLSAPWINPKAVRLIIQRLYIWKNVSRHIQNVSRHIFAKFRKISQVFVKKSYICLRKFATIYEILRTYVSIRF